MTKRKNWIRLPKTPEGTITNRPINTKNGKRWNAADGEKREAFVGEDGKSKKFQKNYITTTAQQQGCFFRRDYSTWHNYSCSGCKFCYSRINPKIPVMDKSKKVNFKIKTEFAFSDTFMKTPIAISRYCDPFSRPTSLDNSNNIINTILSCNGQVIVKTGCTIPNSALNILSKYNKEDILIQLRVVCDNTYIGNMLQKELAPKFLLFDDMLKQAEKLLDLGYDVSFIIDPYIIGLNSFTVPSMIKSAYDIGVKKFTIKQLFATEYFKDYLSKNINPKYIGILNDYYFDKFYTYDNIMFMDSLLPTLELMKTLEDAYLGICCNSTVNSLVCNHDNCCCFDNPIGIYNRDISPMVRSNKDKPLVITLREREIGFKNNATDKKEDKE